MFIDQAGNPLHWRRIARHIKVALLHSMENINSTIDRGGQ